MEKTWEELKAAGWQELSQDKYLVYYDEQPIGTVAACDREEAALNYDQCFIRDFIPVGLLFLIKGNLTITRLQGEEIKVDGQEIVRNFLKETLRLHQQARSKTFTGLILMPASFKVQSENGHQHLEGDFGDRAIARVTPVDSSLWWIILLRAYGKATGSNMLAYQEDFQECIRLILELCFSDRFDREPTLLVPDGACMIDRRMGLYGHFLEIQSLFFTALRASLELLPDNEANQKIRKAVLDRLHALQNYIRHDYWLDLKRLNDVYRFKVEQYGKEALNKFNIYSDSIPYDWLTEWLKEGGGYFAGNIGPSQLDCRFFTLGNLVAVVSGLTTPEQSQKIMKLIDQQWKTLIGQMPMKICYPPLKGRDWELLTGHDPKNKQWSYHNSGNWPVLTWLLTAAALKTGRQDLLKRLKLDMLKAGNILLAESWPEYYDGEFGRLTGREARKFQTWTIAGFLLAQELMDNLSCLELVSFDD